MGLALTLQLTHSNDIRIKDKIISDIVEFDSDSNFENELIQEIIEVYEKTLEMDISRDDRDVIIISLTSLYATTGMCDKAYQLASEQPSIYAGREYIYAFASSKEDREENNFNLMISVLRMLKATVLWSVGTNHLLRSSKEGIEILNELVSLYKKLFPEDLGLMNIDIYDLFLGCACICVRMKQYGDLKNYLDLAAKHKEQYDVVRKNEKYKHISPMFSVEYTGTLQPGYALYRMEDILKTFPDEIVDMLCKEENYKKYYS